MFTRELARMNRTPPPPDAHASTSKAPNRNASLIDLDEDNQSNASNEDQSDKQRTDWCPTEHARSRSVLERVAQLVQKYGANDNIPAARLHELLSTIGREQAEPHDRPITPAGTTINHYQPPPDFNPQAAAYRQPNAQQQMIWQTQPNIYNPYGFHSSSSVNAVNARVQPPAMDKDYIDLWLVRLESWFSNNQVRSDNQQFHILTTLLDSQLLAQVFEAVSTPPATGKYTHLKTAVKSALEESKFKRYQKLLHGGELGDQKPSHRLNELKRLACDGLAMNDSLLKHIWLNHLPCEAQAILAVSGDQTLGALAKLADNVVEGLSTRHVAAITHTDEKRSEEPDYVKQLRKAIDKISAEVKTLQKTGRSRSTTRNSSKQKKGATSPSPEKKKHDQCWYHFKFGDEARNCQPTCERFESFSKN